MKKVRIAHISTDGFFMRYLLLNPLSHLKEAGYEVTGISSESPEVAAIKARGIDHIPVPITRRFTPIADLRSLWRLHRIMRQKRFTIVHTHTPKANLIGQLAARLAGVPIRLSTVHGFYFTSHTPKLKRWFFQIIERLSAVFADAVFLINQEDVDMAGQLRICPASKIRFLKGGIGIDIERFKKADLSSPELEDKRAAFGLPRECKVVGFVGRLVAEKGVLELLEAARLVLKSVPSARFLLVGPVDREKTDAVTPELARTHGVSDSCVFAGLRSDTPDLYQLMDVLVLPSHREGFGLVLAEASAMGIPCVATNIRGCREAVKHEGNGLLVELGDVPGLANTIIELLTNSEKASRMGAVGRQMAVEQFDERLAIEKIKGEYSRLMRDRGLAHDKTEQFDLVVSN